MKVSRKVGSKFSYPKSVSDSHRRCLFPGCRPERIATACPVPLHSCSSEIFQIGIFVSKYNNYLNLIHHASKLVEGFDDSLPIHHAGADNVVELKLFKKLYFFIGVRIIQIFIHYDFYLQLITYNLHLL